MGGRKKKENLITDRRKIQVKGKCKRRPSSLGEKQDEREGEKRKPFFSFLSNEELYGGCERNQGISCVSLFMIYNIICFCLFKS